MMRTFTAAASKQAAGVVVKPDPFNKNNTLLSLFSPHLIGVIWPVSRSARSLSLNIGQLNGQL